MDMLHHFFAPLGQRKDGTYVFAAPVEKGHVPLVVLSDIGLSRVTLSKIRISSGKDFEIASDVISWPSLVFEFHSSYWGKRFLPSSHP